MEKLDAVIIGAGLSGLAAGTRLAQFDKSVCIFEKHSVWGGLNSFYRKGNHTFDVGLHAMTNFSKKNSPRGPLFKVCRQLRIDLDQFKLQEQGHSLISFPTARLRFTNDFAILEQQVSEQFPNAIDGFRKLCQKIRDHDDYAPESDSSRAVLSEFLKDDLLVEMLLCPTMYYGCPTADDMAWNQFVILFKAIFFEGLSRPEKGIRTILNPLRQNYLKLGGKPKLRQE